MSFNLSIDWGNTLVKAGLFEKGQLTNTFSFPAQDAHMKLVDLIEEHKPPYAIISSVSSKSAELEEMLEGKVKKLIKMNDKTPLPIFRLSSRLWLERVSRVGGVAGGRESRSI